MNDGTAVVAVGGKVWNHAHLRTTANKTGNALLDLGITERDSIAVLSPNCPEYLAIHQAALDFGLYCVPINWRFSPAEVLHILVASATKVLFVHSRVLPLALQAKSLSTGSFPICIALEATCDSELVRYETFIHPHSAAPSRGNLQGRLLGFTSATTGKPKGVRRNLVPKLEGSSGFGAVTSTPKHGFCLPRPGVHLCCSQFYHSPVLNLVGSELHLGNTVVIPDGWDPELALSLIERFCVTSLFAVPSMFVRLLKLPNVVKARYDLSSLQFVIHSGAPCPIDVKRSMIAWWGPIIWERYGSVEGPVTLVGPSEWLERPGTVGRAAPGISVAIVDAAGIELPANHIGTVSVRSTDEHAFSYLEAGTLPKDAVSGVRYSVGDIGYVDAQGYLYLCDRELDVIISGGVNIYASEIEQLLVQHSDIVDCAVIATEHSLLGEVPMAVVQLANGVVPNRELTWKFVEYLRTKIAVYKVPHRFEFTEALPRDPNGKLYKRLLRDTFNVRNHRE